MPASRNKKLDLIMIEIIYERLIIIVREMCGDVRRAFSSAVYELHDMSCAVLDGKERLLALSDGDNPQHVLPMHGRQLFVGKSERSKVEWVST